MSIIQGNKFEIWIAPLIDTKKDSHNNTIFVYGKPFQIEGTTLNTLSGSYDIALYGDKINRVCKCMPDMRSYFGKIKEGDKAYLYGKTPQDEKINGLNANYKVISVRPQNIKMQVYFELLPNKK